MDHSTLNTAEAAIVGVYLCSLLLIGYLAKRASRAPTLNDYYLAGGSLGFLSLFFTLYATQYSGNTLFALPGKAYRDGIAAGAFVFGIMGIVLVYHLFAPQLHRLARQHQFVSVGDFVIWRYRSPGLRLAVNVAIAVVLVSFILGNFKAVGMLMASSTGGAVSPTVGIVGIALVMAVYESLGGMRGVIWTDVLQGALLLASCLLIYVFLAATQATGFVAEPLQVGRELVQLWDDGEAARGFISLVVLIAFAAAVYPQALQRIYAARDLPTLQRSYRLMFFMPLLTTLPIMVIGMSGAVWFPELSRGDSENVMLLAINRLVVEFPALAWLRVLFLSAAIAAIMSTVDSALLSLGSTISKDIVLACSESMSDPAAHRFSRRLSAILIAVMAVLAIVLPQTIWALLVLKIELLIQVAPLIILGVRLPSLPGRPFLLGLITGSLLLVGMKSATVFGLPPLDAPLAIHAGLWALAANLAVVGLSLWTHERRGVRSQVLMPE